MAVGGMRVRFGNSPELESKTALWFYRGAVTWRTSITYWFRNRNLPLAIDLTPYSSSRRHSLTALNIVVSSCASLTLDDSHCFKENLGRPRPKDIPNRNTAVAKVILICIWHKTVV